MKALIVCCLTLMLLAACALQAGDYSADVERILRQYGVATDTDSVLKAVADDPRPVVRMAAVGVLANRQAKRSIPVLRAALETEANEGVRTRIGEALIHLQGEGAHELVSGLLQQTKLIDNRVNLARALSELGDFSGYPDVLSGLESPSGLTQVVADVALATFVAKCGPCNLTPSPVDAALQLLKNAMPGRRTSALAALSRRLDDPRVIREVQKASEKDEDQEVRRMAKVFLDQARREKEKPHGDQH